MILLFVAGIALCAGSTFTARAQEAGPIPPPPKFEVKRIPTNPTPEAPPVPVDEIIRRFTANEDVLKQAYENYSFTQTVRVQELADPGGEFSVTGEFYKKPDGQRYERITKPPVSTLKHTTFTLEDIKVLASLPYFILTANELPNYTLEYQGTEKLDELSTYIFRVKPKQVSRIRRFFDGVVWVDDHDFVIVKSSGQFVSEISHDPTQLPFTMFDTYRENFQQKYWFPTYTSSDDYIPRSGGQDLHIRLVVRSTDFKPLGAGSAGPAKAVSPQTAPPQ